MKKVLVIDHSENMELVQIALRRWGYEGVGVETIEEGVRKYREVNPDVFLLEQCREIQGLAFALELCVPNQTPFVVFNAPGHQGEFEDIEKEIADTGGSAVLKKPFHLKILRQVLVLLLGE